MHAVTAGQLENDRPRPRVRPGHAERSEQHDQHRGGDEGERAHGATVLRPSLTAMRVVVVHDYCTQRGGAERVALALLDAFPGAPLVTAAYDPASTFPEFASYDVQPLWVNRVPALRRDPRRALPVLAHAFGRRRVEADLVVASSSGWAHGVRTEAPKLVYCHNPARWLYQSAEYLADQPAPVRAAVAALRPALRRWDRAAARSADHYVANSRVVADRVQAAYGIAAEVVPPPLGVDPHGDLTPVADLEPGYFLTVARDRAYKNVRLLCEAVERLPDARLVAVGDLPPGPWSSRIRALGVVTDAELRWLYTNATALVSAAHEDFGLTPVEANAHGTPAVVLRSGGFLDSLREEVNGRFIERADVDAVVAALREPLRVDEAAVRSSAERYARSRFLERIRALAAELTAPARIGSGGT